MAQTKTFTYTADNPIVAVNQDLGFEVAEIRMVDETNGGEWYWNDQMADASYQDVTDGSITLTNGFTPLSQDASYGASISGFTNAANGVITATGIDTFGFAVGDTIKATGIADDLSSSTSLNGTYTIQSLTSTTITVEESTSGASTYVSGGTVIRVSNSDGDAIPLENKAIRGITIGTDIGQADAVMSGVAKSKEPVL